MKLQPFILSTYLVIANNYATFAAAEEKTENTIQNDNDAVIEWVRSKGGFFSDKISVRNMDPDDPSSPFGVYADDLLKKDDLLIHVPKTCYISVEKTKSPYDDGSNYWGDLCRLSKKLINELNLGPEKSEYGPYVSYLQKQKYGQIPATWSKPGKDLLRKVVGEVDEDDYSENGRNILPPYNFVDWIDVHFKEHGQCINPESKEEEQAVAMVVQRGYDTALVPIWDLVNHNNKDLNTYSTSVHAEDGIKIYANRKIYKNEEIYASYNKCADCGTLTDYWGTPEIFRDFGFIESPDPGNQIWIFANDDEEEYFYVWYDRDPKTLQLDGDSEVLYGYLSENLERITKDIKPIILGGQPDDIPKNEWNQIVQYYSNLVSVLRDILSTMNKNLDMQYYGKEL